MPKLGWGEYRPDVNELDGSHTRSILNVIARGDGYGPLRALASFTTALGAACRGMFYGRNDDNTVTIFAGTATKLYRLSNTDFTWVDVSAGGGSYVSLPANGNWSFTQFGDVVIAVQANEDVQKYDLGSDSAFADLSGSPPDAAYASVVNRFLVLSGLTANTRRVQWSGLDAITTWDGTNSSDFQELPDGGNARPVIGGDYGVILQDFAVRRMQFTQSDTIFDIDRIGRDLGVLAPYSVVNVANLIFFLSPQGFIQMDPAGGGMTPIGREKVDRTFFADWDDGQVQLMQGAADPRSHKVIWVYKSLDHADTTTFNKALIYDWVLQRWTLALVTGEYIASLARPGLTLEALDAVAPGAMAITGLADNGSGDIRVTVVSTASLTTGQYKTVSGVGGSYAEEAIGTFAITVINGTTFDLDSSTVATQAVTGTADNGSGLIRLAMASTADWVTGDKVVVAAVGGTTEANGDWVITVIDATHVDLQGSAFSNAWTSGGTMKDRYDVATDGGLIAGSVDAMTFPFDDITASSLPNVSVADSSHMITFFSGDNLEATLETPEQSGDGQRIRVQGFWPITDATSVRGSISKRENLNASHAYTNETTMTGQGFCGVIRDTRYSRAKIRIPAATTWTFASGVRPEVKAGGKM